MTTVYFMRNLAGAVYIGFDGSNRIADHRREGMELIALMPGTKALESRIHKFFDSYRLSYGTSTFQLDPVQPYIERLLERGLATDREEDVVHVTRVPLPVVQPNRLMAEPLLWWDEQQSTLWPPGQAERISLASKHHLHSSKSDEWYTPIEIVDAARRAVGGRIDLDPASCPKANRRVQAEAYYSAAVSGLDPQHPWEGTVWMNPPYGDLGPQFAARLVREFSSGAVTAACALYSLPHFSSIWFGDLFAAASSIGITIGRVQFDVGADDQIKGGCQPTSGHVVVYLGPSPQLFADAFYGKLRIVTPMRDARSQEDAAQ